MSRRICALAYGVVAYALFLGVFVYACGFVGNLGTPTALDGDLEGSLLAALVANLGLLALFAVEHSVMARPAFKRWWTRIVPEPVERSTYIVASAFEEHDLIAAHPEYAEYQRRVPMLLPRLRFVRSPRSATDAMGTRCSRWSPETEPAVEPNKVAGT